mmetsp:Transcript_24962/g.62427  ORF Transcript_24962/g.62427 Transcript_24962/m.62427 type:complete len:224 (+) Transcript_24962:1384-2055(+)
MVSSENLVRGTQSRGEWAHKGLRLGTKARTERLKLALLISGVLVHNKEVAAAADDDEAEVELTNNIHGAEPRLFKHARQFLLSGGFRVIWLARGRSSREGTVLEGIAGARLGLDNGRGDCRAATGKYRARRRIGQVETARNDIGFAGFSQRSQLGLRSNALSRSVNPRLFDHNYIIITFSLGGFRGRFDQNDIIVINDCRLVVHMQRNFCHWHFFHWRLLRVR